MCVDTIVEHIADVNTLPSVALPKYLLITFTVVGAVQHTQVRGVKCVIMTSTIHTHCCVPLLCYTYAFNTILPLFNFNFYT